MCNYSSVLIFYALILLAQISKGKGLKCYECRSNSTLDAATKNCLDGNEKVPIKEYTPMPGFTAACVTLKRQWEDGYIKVARLGYDRLPGKLGYNAVCASLGAYDLPDVDCEVCGTDLCNDKDVKAGKISH
ncbi:uncharacterized protein LOC135844397 [Planococcus citri]|uniref:uncharacterized protein LOC135844397 n=1 Tax=Planococcus citri TaxID=170843 RepID=UPI0031F726A4